MELEQQVTEQAVVFRPKKRDSAGRDEQQQRAMDTPPASGSRPLYPGSKEQIALGGNKPMPPVISAVDQAYAEKVAEAYSEYPRALYKKAFRRERDAAGKIVPGGEVTPLATADAIAPNYPVPLNMAQRNGVKAVLRQARAARQSSASTSTKPALFLPDGSLAIGSISRLAARNKRHCSRPDGLRIPTN